MEMEEKRRYIVLGDKTSHGGTVVSAQSGMTVDGIPVATVGDEVSCPQCDDTQYIVEGSPSATFNGRALAREGDKVSCGAVLVSERQCRGVAVVAD
jgi:uncharacterized Zn-binding protein involved in type VI secretion